MPLFQASTPDGEAADVIEEGPFCPSDTVVAIWLARAYRDVVENGPMNQYHDPLIPGTFRRLPLV